MEIITNNNHIKSTLVHIFNEFKEKFKYQQALKEKIEEGKNKSKQHKPRFYLNSKNLDLDNEFKDKILAKNYENYDQYNLVYHHEVLNKTTVRKYLSKAYSRYYLRPTYMFKTFKSFISA